MKIKEAQTEACVIHCTGLKPGAMNHRVITKKRYPSQIRQYACSLFLSFNPFGDTVTFRGDPGIDYLLKNTLLIDQVFLKVPLN